MQRIKYAITITGATQQHAQKTRFAILNDLIKQFAKYFIQLLS